MLSGHIIVYKENVKKMEKGTAFAVPFFVICQLFVF